MRPSSCWQLLGLHPLWPLIVLHRTPQVAWSEKPDPGRAAGLIDLPSIPRSSVLAFLNFLGHSVTVYSTVLHWLNSKTTSFLQFQFIHPSGICANSAWLWTFRLQTVAPHGWPLIPCSIINQYLSTTKASAAPKMSSCWWSLILSSASSVCEAGQMNWQEVQCWSTQTKCSLQRVNSPCIHFPTLNLIFPTPLASGCLYFTHVQC